MVDAAAETRQLIRVVTGDPKLPRYVRREAASFEESASNNPALVLDRLEALRKSTIPDLPLLPPEIDYARCVPVDVFWRYHLLPARRDYFATPRDYQRHLEAMADPAREALNHLDDGVLVPAAHSWLIPASRIQGLQSATIKRRLQIDHEPPYMVMMFPVHMMRTAGVRIRKPRGIDAIPGRFFSWTPVDIPDERIDQDIPRSALGGLEWRP